MSISIHNWEDFNNIRNDTTADYILMTDLNSGTTGYSTYAGPTANSNTGFLSLGDFSGTFEGNNHTISDIIMNRPSENFQYPFGNIFGIVRNVKLLNLDIKANLYGGCVGRANEGLIENVEASATIECDRTGGFLLSNSSIIRNCKANVTIAAAGAATGGFCSGVGNGARFYNCSVEGSLTTTIGSAVTNGGFIGDSGTGVSADDVIFERCVNKCNFDSSAVNSLGLGGFAGACRGTFIDCYSSGTVGSTSNRAGFIGRALSGSVFRNCYASGAITATNKRGFVYTNYGAVYENCYYDTTSTTATSDGGGVVSKTTAQMKDINTFFPEWGITDDLDDYELDDGWYIATDSRPVLLWEEIDLSPAIVYSKEGVHVPFSKSIGLGCRKLDSSWRIKIVGDNLEFQRKESGVWVKKGEFLAT